MLILGYHSSTFGGARDQLQVQGYLLRPSELDIWLIQSSVDTDTTGSERLAYASGSVVDCCFIVFGRRVPRFRRVRVIEAGAPHSLIATGVCIIDADGDHALVEHSTSQPARI